MEHYQKYSSYMRIHETYHPGQHRGKTLLAVAFTSISTPFANARVATSSQVAGTIMGTMHKANTSTSRMTTYSACKNARFKIAQLARRFACLPRGIPPYTNCANVPDGNNRRHVRDYNKRPCKVACYRHQKPIFNSTMLEECR